MSLWDYRNTFFKILFSLLKSFCRFSSFFLDFLQINQIKQRYTKSTVACRRVTNRKNNHTLLICLLQTDMELKIVFRLVFVDLFGENQISFFNMKSEHLFEYGKSDDNRRSKRSKTIMVFGSSWFTWDNI